MRKKMNKDFCTECRKETEYYLKDTKIVKNIRDEDIPFVVTVAYCSECGRQMSVPGLIDLNVRQIDDQYRDKESLVTISDIDRLMKIYNIGKAPLSLALGFGEITVTRYLEGQIPSREYSDVIRKALSSPGFMRSKLIENREKLTETAYRKALESVNSIERKFSISDKMLRTIAYIFDQLEEVTPGALQKLLYFIQGVYMARYKEPIFEEDCIIMDRGPVYPDVYELLRDFRYDPKDDARFAILEGTENVLDDKERDVIDLVINTFGLYGTKTLENIAYRLIPGKELSPIQIEVSSVEPVKKEHLMKYFIEINKKYDLSKEKSINKYISDILKSA